MYYWFVQQVSQEFSQIVQRNVRDAFDNDLLDWARAIIVYTKQTQTNNSQLQRVISALMTAFRVCLL